MHTTLVSKAGKTLLTAGLLGAALAVSAQQSGAPSDTQAQAAAQKELHGKQYRDVQVQVVNGVATLTGQVERLSDKLEAEKRIAHTHETASVNDQIEFHVPEGITDAQLEAKIMELLPEDMSVKEIPLDTVLLGVKEVSAPAAPALDNDPPTIFYSARPASLVVFDGDPVLAPAGHRPPPRPGCGR